MAIDLLEKDNIQPADSDFPFGNIRDKEPGVQNGTPVNVKTYGDFHQFFAKMFFESGLTYNNLPDNDYTGFQFYQALLLVAKLKAFERANPVFATIASVSLSASTSNTFINYVVVTDVDEILSVADGKFIPKSGLHKISFGVGVNPSSSPVGSVGLNIYKNGVLFDTITGETLSGNAIKTIEFNNYVINANGTDYYTIVATSVSMDVIYSSARLTIETLNNNLI
jgi:hypothetical protein